MDKQTDKLLDALGLGNLDYDQLTSEERKTYHEMLNMMQSSEITLDKYKEFIQTNREGLEMEISKHLVNPKDNETVLRDIQMKARLQVYLLFEGFFGRPERAKQILDNLKRRVKV